MDNGITIRNYRSDDLTALLALINEADAVDQQERATTREQLEHEMTFPTAKPEMDCFLAWAGDHLVGYTDLYVRPGDAQTGGMIYCWGLTHPAWRRRGVGRRLLDTAYGRTKEIAAKLKGRQVKFQCSARKAEHDRRALYEGFDMRPVRYFVNLVRPINGNLPPVKIPTGLRLRTFDPARDAETVWRVDQTAFRDHWGHTEGHLEEFLHWLEMPHFRPELWFLAEDETSHEVIGLSLNIIDPDWIAQTGRCEGYVDTLAVLREYRQQGLGTSLLVQSLHALRDAGMEAAHLHADAENLTGAMRLYERVGFRVRKTNTAYHKVVQEA
ncbi:MAG: GNAT family N-acetyltransferase [Anaerolineae bacterium]|jgi:mycothiol synthase